MSRDLFKDSDILELGRGISATLSYSMLKSSVSSNFVCKGAFISGCFIRDVRDLFYSFKFLNPTIDVFLVLEVLVEAEKQFFIGKTLALLTHLCLQI